MNLMSEAQDQKLTLSSAKQGGKGEFSALLLAGAGPKRSGVILMHGRNAHPDGAVVSLLRKSLNQLGYTTLSIANPIPEAGDEFPNYVADLGKDNYVFSEAASRIEAALTALKERGIEHVVLLGFSMGARLQAAYLAQNGGSKPQIKGLVALSGGTNGTGPLNIASSMLNIQQPVLDVCGQGDADVASTSEMRQAAYKAGKGESYSQSILPGNAPHNFAGSEKELVETVHSWVSRVAPA
jgi:predicted esterase